MEESKCRKLGISHEANAQITIAKKDLNDDLRLKNLLFLKDQERIVL